MGVALRVVYSSLVILVSQTVGENSGNSSSEVLQKTKGPGSYSNESIASTLSSSERWSQLLVQLRRLDSEFSTSCSTDLEVFISAAAASPPKMWAFSMLDSFGKPHGGLLLGATQWPGSRSQCRSAVQEGAVGKPFHGQFCWASFVLQPSVSQMILQGSQNTITIQSAVCVPDTCTDVHLLKAGRGLTDLYPVPWLRQFIELKDISCPQDLHIWDHVKDSAALIFLIVLVTVVFFATFYDLYQRHKSTEIKQRILPKDTKKTNLSEWLLMFSAYTNGKNLLNMDGGQLCLPAVNGLRVISMMWIIGGHSLYATLIGMGNMKDAVDTMNTLKFETFHQAVLAVDTFYFLSGFLVTYAYLKEYQRTGGNIPWSKFYFHRYWRLTPTYLLYIWVVYNALGKYLGDGPFWTKPLSEDEVCNKFWWANILYINNFMPDDEQCMTHTWYLANDMQFYVFSPLLLIPFTRSVRWSLFIAVLVMTASCSLKGYFAAVYDFPIGLDMVNVPIGSAAYNIFFRIMYCKPYVRVDPYIVGMLTGFLIQRRKIVTMPKVLVVCGWVVCFITMLTITYIVHFSDSLGTRVKVLYHTVSRLLWAACNAWIVVTCCSGYGGIVSRFLSLPIWNPLSRLTYCTFLCHVYVILVMMSTVEVSTHFSFLPMFISSITNTIAAFSSAIVLSLLFESPFARLESRLLRRKHRQAYKAVALKSKETE